jgi:hypothetical protein
MRDLFSSATGQLYHSIAISAASALGISQRLMSLRAASRANPTASPDSEKLGPMSEIFGPSSTDSFASFDPPTRWLKMCQGYVQVSLDGSLVEYSGTWPRAGTMRNGSAYQLPMWERLTSEKGSGLWPTPRAYSFDQSHRPGLTLLDIRVRGLYPDKKHYWPTPLAYDAQGGSSNKSQSAGAATRLSLARMATSGKWPTPMSADAIRGSKTYGRGNLTLLGAAQQWPTPSASPWRSGLASDETYNKNSRPLNEEVLRRSWPTPTAGVGSKAGGRHRGRADTIASAVAEAENLIVSQTGQLNPTWVEWLMGFPIGWTDLSASETLLSPGAPESSDGTSGNTGPHSTE